MMELSKAIFHGAIRRTFSTVQGLGLDALFAQRLFKEGSMKSLGVWCSSYPLLITNYPEHIAIILLYLMILCVRNLGRGQQQCSMWHHVRSLGNTRLEAGLARRVQVGFTHMSGGLVSQMKGSAQLGLSAGVPMCGFSLKVASG